MTDDSVSRYFELYRVNLNGVKKTMNASLVPIYNAACMPVLLIVKYSAELNKYIRLVRVICEKYRFRGQKIIASSLNQYFSQITLTNRIYLLIPPYI